MTEVKCSMCSGTASVYRSGNRMTQSISGQTIAVCRFFHDEGGDPQDCPHMKKAIQIAVAMRRV